MDDGKPVARTVGWLFDFGDADLHCDHPCRLADVQRWTWHVGGEFVGKGKVEVEEVIVVCSGASQAPSASYLLWRQRQCHLPRKDTTRSQVPDMPYGSLRFSSESSSSPGGQGL